MPENKNAVWRFLASVKLALTTLFVLAGTSIIGTVIQQGQAPSFYVEKYGEGLARLLQTLDFTNMYTSWWYISLLVLFTVNLVVCSIERLPGALRMVVREDPATDPSRLERMESGYRTQALLPAGVAADRIQQILTAVGWKSRKVERDGSTVLFAQKGAWTRLGAHIVHLSILIIFAGAAIGAWFGYKAFVFLPEGRSTTNVFLQSNSDPVPLGFELAYDRFEMLHYPNGMIREYRSDLTVYDQQRSTPYHKTSIVNDPLSYGGHTFYIGDNYPIEEYLVEIRHHAGGTEQAFRIPAEREVAWPGTDVVFSIEELRTDAEGAVRQALVRFSNGESEPTLFWMDNNSSVTFAHVGQEFTLSFRQLYTTLFLVARDPGVATVYFGFILMVIGLCISFFLSHQRIWIYIAPGKDEGSQILLGGHANKHKPAFEGRFQELVNRIQKDEAFTPLPQKQHVEKPQKKKRKAA